MRPARLAASLALALWLVPVAAIAHAFLADSSPEGGERLSAPPRTIELHFTESVVSQSVSVALKTSSGAPVDVKDRTFADGNTTVRVRVPPLSRGIYLVDWRAISGGDGHLSAGEFAFAFGAGAGIPAAAQQQTAISWPQTIARFLLVTGVALAAGAVLVELLFVTKAPTQSPSFAAFYRASLLLALVAGIGQCLLFAAGLGPDGTLLRLGALASALRTSVGLLDGATIGAILYALTSSLLTRSYGVRIVPLLVALIATALQSHPAATGVLWKQLAIGFHVMLAVLWAGTLMLLAWQMFRRSPQAPQCDHLRAVRGYSSLAIFMVGIVLVTGILAAIAVIPTPTQLLTSGYGRILLVKVGLIVVALVCAAIGRRVLARGADGLDRLGRLMPLEGIFALMILAAASLLGNVAPPYAASFAGAGALLGVAIPKGLSLTVGARAGWLEAFVTASARDLTLTITGPGDVPPADVRLVTKDARGNAIFVTPQGKSAASGAIGLAPRSCGLGCFTVPYRWQPGETHVRLELESTEWEGGSTSFTILWPPAPTDRQIIHRMIAALRTEKAVRIDETTSSAPQAYSTVSHRLSGAQIASGLPYSEFVRDVRPFPKAADGFVLYLPASHLWARVWLDAKSRPQRQLTISPGLEVDDRFSYRHSR